MKKLIIILLVLMLAVSLASCTGNNGATETESTEPTEPKNSEVKETQKAETGISFADVDGEFTKEQIEYINSLGKSEEGKRLVCYNAKNGSIIFHVAQWNDEGELISLTDHTVYYTNASYTAKERYEKEMEDYQDNWELYEANDIDPASGLPIYSETDDELCITTVDRMNSSYSSLLPMYKGNEDIAKGLYDNAVIVD